MLLRNWQTFPNSSIAITAQKDILYWLKSVLTNTNGASNTLPSDRVWTVISSSNASTTSNSDLWTSTSALTRAAAGTAHSWIVLRNTTLGVYMILDYVGTLNYAADVVISTDAPTGGTTLNRPTATVTFSFAGWNFDRPTLTAETRYVSMTSDEYGSLFLHHHRANGEMVIVATLGLVKTLLTRDLQAGANSTISPFSSPQTVQTTETVLVGLQHGGNQTGNAHIMTPSASNTAAKVFAGNGGMLRGLHSSGSYNNQCIFPPLVTNGAATFLTYFGTVGGGGSGSGIFSWPLIAYTPVSGATLTSVIPDTFVSPQSTNWTVATASSGGPLMHVRKPGTAFNATTNPYEGLYCNGIVVPWGASSTVIQGSTNSDAGSGNGWRQFPIPDPGQQTGNRGANITAARGTRGVGGW